MPPSQDPEWFKFFIHDRPLPALFTTFDETLDQLVKSALFLSLVAAIWFAVHALLNAIYPRFAAISPTHKKWYVIANVSKFLMLGLAFSGPFTGLFPSWQIHYDVLLRDQWVDTAWTTHGALTKRWALWYAATDALALMIVPKMPTSTVVHHWITVAFVLMLWSVNLGDDSSVATNIAKLIDVYGCWSAFPCSVNLLLALRVLYDQTQPVMVALRLLSFAVYVVACALNWTWQVKGIYACLVAGELTVWHGLLLLYAAGLSLVVYDDIVLMKWLLHPTSKKQKQTKTKQEKDE